MSLGSPLQQIAMGMVIVIGSAPVPSDPSPAWRHYDLLADPAGWLLVVLGTVALARADDRFDSARWLAALAGAVSAVVWFPQVSHLLDAPGEWFVSLPQVAFCLWLSREIGLAGAQQAPPDGYVAKRFGVLVWGFAAVGVLPVVAIGGGVRSLEHPTLLVSSLVSLAFVYFLFRVHRRAWLGGPGPLEIHPRTRESRPPST
jgi:hypothetical protein